MPLKKGQISLAEREGFEPPDLLQSTVFKTAAFDRSAISPWQKYSQSNYEQNENSTYNFQPPTSCPGSQNF